MAPLNRMGASDTDISPTALHATYYAHRATAGLIVTEGASISREAVGWADTPGLWRPAQLRGAAGRPGLQTPGGGERPGSLVQTGVGGRHQGVWLGQRHHRNTTFTRSGSWPS